MDVLSNFRFAKKNIYEASGLVLTNLQKEVEGAEYGALEFDLNSRPCKFREGKITPKKAGFFVTLWKRVEGGPILPYDVTDLADYYIFSVRSSANFGQFIFPKNVLYERGILSKERKGGKRALRLYPPWVLAPNRQAKCTQSWQVQHFIEISENSSIDSSKIRQLLR